MLKIIIAILTTIASIRMYPPEPIEMYKQGPIEMYPMEQTETQEEDIWAGIETDSTIWGTQEASGEPEAPQPEEIPTEETEAVSEAICTPTSLPVTFDSIDASTQALYWSYAAYEPQQVIDALNAYNVIITVGPDGRYSSGHAGECVFRHGARGTDNGIITIGINAKSDNSVAISTNHEIGHALDEIIGMMAGISHGTSTYNPYPTMTISNSPEFQAIYAAECASAGYPIWNSQNTLEWFAETYRYVVEGNETMRQRAPQSYEWVRQTVNTYLGTTL